MALAQPPEILAVARVNMLANAGQPTYDFADGFETVSPPGATPGSPPIRIIGAGDVQLFLQDACAPGTPTKQGGIKASVEMCEVGSAGNADGASAKAMHDVTYYSAPGGAYAAVDQAKVLRVRLWDNANAAFAAACKFDIIVYRVPLTII